jgi:hypothetical protein
MLKRKRCGQSLNSVGTYSLLGCYCLLWKSFLHDMSSVEFLTPDVQAGQRQLLDMYYERKDQLVHDSGPFLCEHMGQADNVLTVVTVGILT